MQRIKKWIFSLIIGWVLLGSSSVFAAIHVGVWANFDWCMNNSGAIAITYEECVGLAWLYQETNGANWWEDTNRFLHTDLGLWAGANGNHSLFRDAFQNPLSSWSGHITELYLYDNSLSGSIMTWLLYLPHLTVLSLGANYISSVNLSQLTWLLHIDLGNNWLTSIDISLQRSLRGLTLRGNAITSLDFSNNTGLVTFNMTQTPYSGHLSFSGYNSLQNIYLSGAGISYIDITYNTGLGRLNMTNTPLTWFAITTHGNYSGLLVSNFDGTNLSPTNLDLNTLWFLQNTDPNRGFRGFGGQKRTILPVDNCPNGDMSPTQYDGLCAGLSLNNGGISAQIKQDTTGNALMSNSETARENNELVETDGDSIDAHERNEVKDVDPMLSTWMNVDTCEDEETHEAYLFARKNSVTTMDTCQKARTNNHLTRWEAAKMIVNFAMNVLNKQPDVTRTCVFADMDVSNAEMKQYASMACQLGIMWLKGDGTPAEMFNPAGLLDKAQLATMLSRILYGDANNSTACWYCKHVEALQQDGVITVTTDLSIPLLRGRAMLMMKRMAE